MSTSENLRIIPTKFKLSDLCRLCLTTNTNRIEIFGPVGRQINISGTIGTLFNSKVLQEDRWPQSICMPCCEKLTEFHGFYNTVKSTEATLVGLCGQREPPDCSIKVEDHEEEVSYLEEEHEEIAESEKDDPKSPEMLEFLQNFSLEMKEDCAGNASEVLEGDLIDVVEEDAEEEREDNIPLKKRKQSTKSPRKQPNVASKSKRNTNSKSVTNDEIQKYVKLTCSECITSYRAFEDLMQHFRYEHNEKGYVKCCNLTIKDKPTLVEHIEYHKDPTKFQCKECGKCFKTARAIHDHLPRHSSMEERKFQCAQCLKRFSTKIYLNVHMVTHIPAEERQTACPECNKIFASVHVMKNHIERIHKRKQMRVCEICAKVFKTTESFQNHQMKHEGIERQKKECEVCGKKFTDRQGLRRHRLTHVVSTEIFHCTICGQEFKTKHHMQRHRGYAHSDKIFKCNLCDREFKRSINLKEHLATHTGQQSLYKCNFCEKMFNSNANRYVHQKRNHPIEWDQERRKKLEASEGN